jgi:branched-chain amino acid transport system substrate-binding protein
MPSGEQRGLKREQAARHRGCRRVKHPIAAGFFSLPAADQSAKPDVLFLCNFGYDQTNSIKQAIEFGFKNPCGSVPVLRFSA